MADQRRPRVKPLFSPFRPDETWEERHARRLAISTKAGSRAFAKTELAKLGLQLVILQGGHRWRVFRLKELIGEWWPESASLRFESGDTSHVHDVIQLVDEIKQLTAGN